MHGSKLFSHLSGNVAHLLQKIAVVSWYPFYNDGAIMVFIKAGMLKILKDFE